MMQIKFEKILSEEPTIGLLIYRSSDLHFCKPLFYLVGRARFELATNAIKHPAASSEVLKALFRLLVFNQPSPQGARN